ncbi:capsule biosynthesis GfcC family protein [Pseudomonas sp. 10S4]|uniref:capsule biosynthesis GfcC family protein n=1 Tax=Pseudomonas sp. 10S4 TaxID=3048583 RepID=UPI002AC9AC85|nr:MULTISPECIES: capsule biosynthesis GfcC family protein [unclassified Pseudomonas]MEB0225196.1 capsule biosynthesis GfcC family protein [Pseudomonas sp. 5S1]MEB0293992.1 capsule biosynthesis GfcC family protein [Pseudomonas sp. 10S4]WPX17012.1 capsule biosynthesis GfcC family protein [Pseudomonas sp. 10S4]
MKCQQLLLLGLLLIGPGLSQAAVTVSGDVRSPGDLTLKPGTRLRDVIIATQPNAESYWLGAAWLHRSLEDKQTRLKAGVLFDLKLLQRVALLDGRDTRAALSARLYEQIERMPVTGRQIAALDPIALETGFALNALLDDGDRLIYPARPSTVEVWGAVAQPCHVPFDAMQEARAYAEHCAVLSDAESDYLWLIQPDGQVRRVGVAAWNREEGIVPAPGSRILVPIRIDDLESPTPELNQQLAEFLATQPLAEVAP